MLSWSKLKEMIDTRSMRERVLIGASVLALVYLLSSQVLMTAIEKQHQLLESRMETAKQEIDKFAQQEKVLVQQLSTDPNAPQRREIKRLEETLAQHDEKLEQLAAGLIPANKLPQVLHDVLETSGRLELVGMQTRAPKHLQFSTHTSESGANPISIAGPVEVSVGIYKHTVTAELRGKYFDVVNYLSALENLDWKFYWEAIDYQVERYPSARIVLEVYTLSTDKGIIDA